MLEHSQNHSDKKEWTEWNEKFVNALNQIRRGSRDIMFAIQSYAIHTKEDHMIKEKLLQHGHFKSAAEIAKFEEDLNDILIDRKTGEAAARFKSTNDGRNPNSIAGYAKMHK